MVDDNYIQTTTRCARDIICTRGRAGRPRAAVDALRGLTVHYLYVNYYVFFAAKSIYNLFIHREKDEYKTINKHDGDDAYNIMVPLTSHVIGFPVELLLITVSRTADANRTR